ncbi:unnamed protein product, partial [Ectocarpus fasciculatus]
RERLPLSQRLARGVPVLGATGLWQLLSRLDGPPSLLDPLAAVLSWFFLELIMVSVPSGVWNKWDMGNPERAAAAAVPPPLPQLMVGPEEGESKEREGPSTTGLATSPLRWDAAVQVGEPEARGTTPSNGATSHHLGGGGGGGSLAAAFEEVAPVTPHSTAVSEPGPRKFVRRKSTAHIAPTRR